MNYFVLLNYILGAHLLEKLSCLRFFFKIGVGLYRNWLLF